ncbi:MAG: DUF5916 domain-containing protein [Gammaproteobacteria bacterium]|nr:DUF5916 domain-containing protein [Gammaproteobacteria bacterium]
MRLSLLLLLVSFSGALCAQTPPAAAPHQIPKLPEGIVIDGQLDDAAWASAGEFELPFEISPGDNIAAPVTTKARIGYTETALYVSFRANDPKPGDIRARLRDRDAAYRDDFIGIMVDTFDDQRRAYEFFVNPLGVQMDLIKDQATGDEDDSWDGLWTSAGRTTDAGYEVEMRIPFATLRFREGEQVKRWALSFFRSYPRSARHQITNQKVSRDSNCFLCTFEKFEGMAGVRPGRNLDVVPTITIARPEYRNEAGSPWLNDGVNIEPGVDVSWSPSPNLTLNGTINPDFSQVETDQAQLNLNDSFALFFPEKRPFFLEGADYFNTQFNVLYTRQISDPSWGVRVTGRNGDGTYGAFVAQDTTTLLLVPGVLGSGFRVLDQSADVAVARYRYNLNENTTLGVIGTFRHGDDYANDVVGVDGRYQKGAHTVTAQLLRSDSEYPLSLDFADASPSGNALRAFYNYGNREWDFTIGHTKVDPGFRADLGFVGQVGFDRSLVGGSHTWYGKEGDKITRMNLYTDFDITHRFDGQLLERELETSFNIQGPMQSSVNFSALTRVRFWNEQMFDETNLAVSVNVTPWSGIRLGTYIGAGKRVDLRASREGRLTSWEVWGEVDLGRGISIVPNASWSQMKRDGGTAFTALVFDTRVSWQLDPRQRLRLTLQGSHIERDLSLYEPDSVGKGGREWGGQLLYSYKVNPRTAFYGGVSYGAVRDDDELAPDMFGNNRGVFLKYSYGWQPGG